MLIYETFGLGNEVYGRTANPAFLLRTRELIEAVGTDLHVLAYENGFEVSPKPAVVQRICAMRGSLPDAGQKQNFFLNS